MKLFNPFILIAVCLLMLSCSKETLDSPEAAFTLETSNLNSIAIQIPNSKLDNSAKGIYHGIVASGTTLSRGKIWVNLGNDSSYTAIVEMVGGQHYNYTLDLSASDKEMNRFVFVNKKSSFTIDTSDFLQPILENVVLDQEPYFASAVKGTNNRMPFSLTGTFIEDVAGATFSGTWNLISSGVTAPEGFGYELIGQTVVTFNGNMFTDSTMEQFNYPCIGNPAFNAQLGDFVGNANAIIAHSQTSNFNGTTNWDLGTANGDYYNNSCSLISSGSFSWTSATSGTTRNGLVFID